MKFPLVVLAVSLILAQATAQKKVVCYFGSWSVYRPGDGAFDLSFVDPKLCTHMIYTFVGVSNTSDAVEILDPWCDLPNGGGKDNIARFNKLREQNPNLKTMVAIGGWNQGSTRFSQVAADPNSRRRFVESVVTFVKQYGFDGFDVDWEYPAQREGSSPADKQNYVLLLKELRERFDQEGLLLSAAVAAPESSASISYDIPQISKYLHFINLMAYDLHSADDRKTGMNAALYPAASESGNDAKLNIDSVIQYWLSQGAPAEKLILGVPFYGKSFTLSNPQSNGVGALASAVGSPGPYTGQEGMLGYNEICEKFQQENWSVQFDEERRVPYAVNGNQWVSYDDEQSLKEKTDLIKKYGLGGGMAWSIETDDFRGKCGEKFPLLKTLNNELLNGASSSSSVLRPKGSALKNQPSYQQQQYQPNYQQQQQYEPDHSQQQYQPDYSQQQQQYEPDYSQHQYEPSYNDQQYPQQQPAHDGQLCQAEGFVQDPQDCSKFYSCQFYNGEFHPTQMLCPPGTLYDSSNQICNHAALVQC